MKMKKFTTFALSLLIVCASMLGSCDNKKTTDSDDAVTTGGESGTSTDDVTSATDTGDDTNKEIHVKEYWSDEDLLTNPEFGYFSLKIDEYRDKLGLSEAQKKELSDIYEYDKNKYCEHVFKVYEILGSVPDNFERITLEEFKGEIFEKIKTIYNDDSMDSNQQDDAINKMLSKRQRWPDLTYGSGVAWYEYWFNDEGTEGVKFVFPSYCVYFNNCTYADLDKFQSEFEDTGSTYTVKLEPIIDTDTLYSESYQNSIGLTDVQKQQLNELKPEESHPLYNWRHIAAEMKILGKIPNDFKSMTYAEAEKIIEDSKKIANAEERREYIKSTFAERQYQNSIKYNSADGKEIGRWYYIEGETITIYNDLLYYSRLYEVK